MTDGPVIVTGASGFLGETVCRVLAAQGRPAAGLYFGNPVVIPRVTTVPVDLTDELAVGRLLRDARPSAVIHCAAMTDAGACERDPDAARQQIVGMTANLAAAIECRAPGIPLVMVSTDLVFDGESAPYAPDAAPKPLSVYGSLKSEAEQLVLALDGGCVVRAALLFGPPTRWRGGFLRWMVEALSTGKPLTLFEDEVRTPVDTRDVAALLAAAVSRRLTGILHAGGPERLTRMEMGRQLAKVLGAEENLLVPARLADTDSSPPRPRDVSLDSASSWQAAGLTPRRFAEALPGILAGNTTDSPTGS